MKNLFIIIFLLTLFGCKKSDDGTAAIAGGNTTAAFTFNTVAGANGRIWMDRNLGATQVATSSTDVNSYGDLYQWGRGTDGHQKRTSKTTNTISSTNSPGDIGFIIGSDWRSGIIASNIEVWNGTKSINNPCPTGYRVPTMDEWKLERASWSSNDAAGAFSSPLKLPMAGWRNSSNGIIMNVNAHIFYWSSTAYSYDSFALFMTNGSTSNDTYLNRATGGCLRCIKD